MYSDLLNLDSQSDYEELYKLNYCQREIRTHDGHLVKFRPEEFNHAFFCNADRRTGDKSIFSTDRAKRIMWIEKVLKDPSLCIYAGWDSKKKRYDHSRRVTLVTSDGYVVVLRVGKGCLIFVTAYIIDDPKVKTLIMSSPIWGGEHMIAND